MKKIISKFMSKFEHNKSAASSGFTLVETLVAIAILMIAIAGPLTVAEKGLSASIYARDQLTASYLAQDAMEYIRNIVDTDQITISQSSEPNINWLDTSSGSEVVNLSQCTSDDPCLVDTINDNIEECGGSSGVCKNYPLLLGQNGYEQNTGQQTAFTRYLYLKPFDIDQTQTCDISDAEACEAMDVVVEVTWPGYTVGGGGVTLEDTIYNTPPQ